MTPAPGPQVRLASPTERRNPATEAIDEVGTLRALEMVHAEDARVIPAVGATLPTLAGLIDTAAERVRAGGIVHYFGAGTSGRLAVLDAAELLPTYGVDDVVVAHHAGGSAALVTAAENVEDSAADGARDAADVTDSDVVIGVTASGRTPYVAGAMRAAQRVGAATALITANPAAELAPLADYLLAADTGAEAVTGSTRMKAGTATKLILNAFSTVLMVRLGHVYSNLMIDMRATNAKLRGRSVEMLLQATGEPWQRCADALAAAGDIPTALVMLLTAGVVDRGEASGGGSAARGDGSAARGDGSAAGGDAAVRGPAVLDPDRVAECRRALREHDGRVRDAVAQLSGSSGPA